MERLLHSAEHTVNTQEMLAVRMYVCVSLWIYIHVSDQSLSRVRLFATP